MPAALLAAVLVWVVLTLGGCGTRDPLIEADTGIVAGPWRIERAIDRITSAPVSSAYTTTRQVANTSLNPIALPEPAMLQLGCFKGQPIARFGFRFKIGSTRNAQLGYAFDKNPGHEPVARFVDGYTTVVIEDRGEIVRFVDELAHAKTLYIRIRSLNAGRTSAEFQVAGAAEAIAAAYAGCPPTPLPQAPQVKGSKTAALLPPPAEVEPEDAPEPLPGPAASGQRWQSEEEAALRQVMGWFGR